MEAALSLFWIAVVADGADRTGRPPRPGHVGRLLRPHARPARSARPDRSGKAEVAKRRGGSGPEFRDGTACGWRPYGSTGLPIIVAATSVAVWAGQMSDANGSLLVAGGALTVLLLPMAGTLLHRPDRALEEATET